MGVGRRKLQQQFSSVAMPPLYNPCRIKCGNVSVVDSSQICADALLQQCLPTMALQQHQGLMQWREVTAAPTTARVAVLVTAAGNLINASSAHFVPASE